MIISRSWQIWKSDLESGSGEAYSDRVLIATVASDPPIGDLSNRSLIAEKSELEGSKMVNSTKTATVRSSIHTSSSNTLVTLTAERELYPRSAMYPPPTNVAITPPKGLRLRSSDARYRHGRGHSFSSSKSV